MVTRVWIYLNWKTDVPREGSTVDFSAFSVWLTGGTEQNRPEYSATEILLEASPQRTKSNLNKTI